MLDAVPVLPVELHGEGLGLKAQAVLGADVYANAAEDTLEVCDGDALLFSRHLDGRTRAAPGARPAEDARRLERAPASLDE